jgi:hypothetical protein
MKVNYHWDYTKVNYIPGKPTTNYFSKLTHPSCKYDSSAVNLFSAFVIIELLHEILVMRPNSELIGLDGIWSSVRTQLQDSSSVSQYNRRRTPN